MAKGKDTIEAKVLALLEGAGATIDNIERKNHMKIKWTYRDQKRMVVFPQTASNCRAEKNAVAHVRRDIREIDSAD